MQQTLFAVVALVIVGGLVLNMQRGRVDHQERTVSGELEAQARGVAGQVLDHIAGFPFDGQTASTPSGFTPEAQFGIASRSYTDPAIADVDDFHGITPHTITRRVYSPATGRNETMTFTVEVTVRYVTVTSSAVGPSGGAPSYHKEAAATIRHAQMRAPVVLSRVFSYGT